MRTKNDHSRPKVRFDKEAAESAKTLIANLIVTPKQVEKGIVSRINDQGKYKIEPDILSGNEWMVARMSLRIMEALAAEGIPATKEVILNKLLLGVDEKQAQAVRRYSNNKVRCLIGKW